MAQLQAQLSSVVWSVTHTTHVAHYSLTNAFQRVFSDKAYRKVDF